VERAIGIEPTTYSLGSCRSTTELRPRNQPLSQKLTLDFVSVLLRAAILDHPTRAVRSILDGPRWRGKSPSPASLRTLRKPLTRMAHQADHAVSIRQRHQMNRLDEWRPDLNYYGVPRLDPGWIYVVKTGNLVKIGKTTDPKRRLLREARTWSPEELEIVGVKPFWNISRIEYSLHSALAEFWHRGEWHKFNDEYWLKFFLDKFRAFSDHNQNANSVEFIYWMNRDNYVEAIRMRMEHKMSLRKWQECRGDPWRHLRPPAKIASDNAN
jgi:hypothetical protein